MDNVSPALAVFSLFLVIIQRDTVSPTITLNGDIIIM